MSDFDPTNEEIKKAMKEAFKEWLDHKYAAFGKWSFHGLLVLAFAGLIYLALVGAGFHWSSPQ